MTMSPLRLPPDPPDCESAFERMPWMINGSLAPLEATALQVHVARCQRCRARLDAERDLFRAIRRPLVDVESAPLAAWDQFERTLDRGGGEPSLDAAGAVSPASRSAARAARAPRRGPLRLALTLQAAAIVALSCALLWLLLARSGTTPVDGFHTVSTADPAIALPEGAWRIAFDPATTAPAANALLAAHGLRVIAGPSRDNVYTAAPARVGTASVDALRADPQVRLLEPLGHATGGEVP